MDVRISDEHHTFIQGEVQSGRFASPEQVVDEALRRFEAQQRDQSPPTAAPSSLWPLAQRVTAAIPDEVLARLPVDGSTQHDHYIHGTPRRADHL